MGAGDFNEIRVHSSMAHFRETVEDCDLQDLGFRGAVRTWNNGQGVPDNIQERLDRVLVNEEWRILYAFGRVYHRDFFRSDHRALHVVLDEGADNMRDYHGNKQFHFEPLWRSKEEYKDVVLGMWFREAIRGDGAALMRTLDRCAQALKRWGKDTFGYIPCQGTDKEAVLEIPLGFSKRNDCFIWHFGSKGLYSVKSGYKLEMMGRNEEGSPGLASSFHLGDLKSFYWGSVLGIMQGNSHLLMIPLHELVLYWVTTSCNGLEGSKVRVANSVVSRWSHPTGSFVKANVDASVKTGIGFIGISIVIRDGNEGAKMLEVCGFPNWVIESDAINVVRAVLFPTQLAPEASIITDIKDAISQAHGGNVC
ncbi:hypothetical protein TIFTF001_026881 [Ficus carica]|uniref:Uncharacterized protein n=1 Tax=Ficus carica TaxID=3494 RepID=A0AA88DM40_FICCA|nr:hypothetical protein TIFTF001_026881 [Ficus carica]